MAKPDRKKRKTSQLSGLVDHVLREFARTDNQELLTFKIPTLLEYLLVFLLANRLNVAEDDLPNLDYTDLATIALAGTQYAVLRNQVILFGQVRNYLAHYLDRHEWIKKVREFVASMGLPVPSTEPQLLLFYDIAMSNVFIVLMVEVNEAVGGSADKRLRTFIDAKNKSEAELLKAVVANGG